MKKYLSILLLSFIAFINASYLSYKAYIFIKDPLGLTSLCDINKIASCSEVLRHPLSQIFGIPFPWIALLVYPVIFALAFWGYKSKNIFAAKAIAALSFGGVLFNGFIIYREIRFIHAYCLLCLMCSAIILAIHLLSWKILCDAKKQKTA